MTMRLRCLLTLVLWMGGWGLVAAPGVALGQCDPEDPTCQPMTPVSPVPTTTPVPAPDAATVTTLAAAPPIDQSQDVWDCLDDAVQCVLNMTRYVIEFPARTLQEALLTIAQDIGTGFYRAARENLVGPLDQLITGPLGIAPGGGAASAQDNAAAVPVSGLPQVTVYQLFRDDFIVSRVAMQVRNLAFALLPFTLILSLADALKKGAESVLGRAELQTAVVRWITSVVGVAICFPTLSLIYSMSVSLYQYAFTAALGSNLGNLGRVVLEAVLGEALLLLVSSLNPALAGLLALSLVVILFLVILAVLVLGALALGLAASVALIGILATIGPICIALSTLEPLEWLDEMWIRGVGIALFLPVIDLFILGFLMAVIGQIDRSGLWGAVLSALIAFGLTGLLISLNMAVGNAVFGPVLQAAKMTGDIVTAIGGMVTTAVTMGAAAVALGPAALGAASVAAGAGSEGGLALAGGGAGVAGLSTSGAAGAGAEVIDLAGSQAEGASSAGLPERVAHAYGQSLSENRDGTAVPANARDGRNAERSASESGRRAREAAREANQTEAAALGVRSRARLAKTIGRVLASDRVGSLGSVGRGLVLGAELAEGQAGDRARAASLEADEARDEHALDREQRQEAYRGASLGLSRERNDTQRKALAETERRNLERAANEEGMRADNAMRTEAMEHRNDIEERRLVVDRERDQQDRIYRQQTLLQEQAKNELLQQKAEYAQEALREQRIKSLLADLRSGQEPGGDAAYRRRANGRQRDVDRRARDDASNDERAA